MIMIICLPWHRLLGSHGAEHNGLRAYCLILHRSETLYRKPHALLCLIHIFGTTLSALLRKELFNVLHYNIKSNVYIINYSARTLH